MMILCSFTANGEPIVKGTITIRRDTSPRKLQQKFGQYCNECRQFLCKKCSDTHLLHKSSQNHSLTNMDPSRKELISPTDDELASYFLEQATVSETTVLYRAQVAVESKLKGGKDDEHKKISATKSKENVDSTKEKPTKVQEFSVKRADDTCNVHVTAVLTLNDRIITADSDMRKLKLFDSSGKYLSSTDMEQYPWGITRVDKDKFATCGSHGKVFIWTLSMKSIRENVTFTVDNDWAYGIHFNNTYYCVLHRSGNAVTILDRQGRHVRKIVLKQAFGKKIEFGLDIHMDNETNDIFVPCRSYNKGVLCLSVEGEVLWFTPILGAMLRGISEINGVLCIADIMKDKPCLHLVSKTGQYIRELLGKKERIGNPSRIHYSETVHKLCISYVHSDIISVYSLQ